MLKYGANNIGKIFLGSNEIGKAFLGSNLVFQKDGGQPQPTVNYLISGAPTINGTIMTMPAIDGSRDFIYTPERFAPGSSDWSIETAVRYHSFAMNNTDLFATVTDDGARNYSITLQNDTNHTSAKDSYRSHLYLSSNGTSWNKMSGTKYVTASLLETWYGMRVTKIGNAFRVQIRNISSGGNWGDNGSQTITGITFNSRVAFGGGFANRSLNADFDLAYTKIYIDGSLWWEAITNE